MPIPEDERVKNELLAHKRIDDQRINDQQINDEQINDRQIEADLIDEKFEAHLKEFRPLAPAPLPVDSRVHAPRRWPVLTAWVAAAAAVVMVAVLLAFHSRPGRIAPQVESVTVADHVAKPQSLTIRTANALLVTAPSFKDAIDEMAFPPKPAPLPPDKRSALAELSKEKIKL